MPRLILSPPDFADAISDGGSLGFVKLPRHPRPRSYLQFAIDDLAATDCERNRVNALSNAKRALHFQVETISTALGFDKLNIARAPFPRRLDFCEACGVASPRILRRLNQLRNAIEHEYYLPSRTEAETFVDVVDLFLSATHPLIVRFPEDVSCDLVVKQPSGDCNIYASLAMKVKSGSLRITARRRIAEDGKLERTNKFKKIVRAKDGPVYTEWVNALLKIWEN